MHAERQPRTFWWTPLLLVAIAAAGCGSGVELGPTIDATGQVTLDGQPFSEASIRFTSLRTAASFATDLADDGTYQLELLDAQPGDKFGVSFGPILVPPAMPEVDAAGIPKGNPPPPLPARYLEHTESGLTETVTDESSQTFNFDLKSK